MGGRPPLPALELGAVERQAACRAARSPGRAASLVERVGADVRRPPSLPHGSRELRIRRCASTANLASPGGACNSYFPSRGAPLAVTALALLTSAYAGRSTLGRHRRPDRTIGPEPQLGGGMIWSPTDRPLAWRGRKTSIYAISVADCVLDRLGPCAEPDLNCWPSRSRGDQPELAIGHVVRRSRRRSRRLEHTTSAAITLSSVTF